MNVAITRQKYLLIIFGNQYMMQQNEAWEKLYYHILKFGFIENWSQNQVNFLRENSVQKMKPKKSLN